MKNVMKLKTVVIKILWIVSIVPIVCLSLFLGACCDDLVGCMREWPSELSAKLGSLRFRVNDTPVHGYDLCVVNRTEKRIVKVEHSLACDVSISKGQFKRRPDGRFMNGRPNNGNNIKLNGLEYFWGEFRPGFATGPQSHFHFSSWVEIVDKVIKPDGKKFFDGSFYVGYLSEDAKYFNGNIHRFRATFADGKCKEFYCWPWDLNYGNMLLGRAHLGKVEFR